MIEIKILIVLDEIFDFIKDDFISSHEIDLIALDDEELEDRIVESDIVVILINRRLCHFDKVLYEKIDKEYLSVYFHDLKINLNTLSLVEMKEIQEVQLFKKSISSPNIFDIDALKKDLENKIIEKEKSLNPEIETTYLNAIKIKEYFSIKDMEIDDLAGNKEIYFVGENGDGKTVLLQAIVLALKHNEYSDLAKLYISKEQENNRIDIATKDENNSEKYIQNKNLKNIFAYGINRNKINNKESEKSLGYSALFDTPSITRTTYLREPEILLAEDKAIITEQFIPKIEQLLGSKLKISTSDNRVVFQELDGDEIQFDMLSEGYKTTLIWLCDLLSRLMDNDSENENEITELKDFQAIVLIDEVDLYLHPKWKYDFVHKLRQIFEGIQFIMTTHSLVTVLGASEDAVFYKVYKENGETKITEQINDISHYTANILITSPLFDLDSMKVRGFDKNESLSSDGYEEYELNKSIDEMLLSPDDDAIKDSILRQLEQYNEKT